MFCHASHFIIFLKNPLHPLFPLTPLDPHDDLAVNSPTKSFSMIVRIFSIFFV